MPKYTTEGGSFCANEQIQNRCFLTAEQTFGMVHLTLQCENIIIKGENQRFLQFKDSAEAVNSYIIENFGYKANEDDNSIFVEQENGKILGLYGEGHIEIPEHLLDDFNIIKNEMKQSDTDFYIDIKTDRISYGGLSEYMYVYSLSGKVPDYYFYKGDRQHPKVYSLGDNWYLLKVNFR